MNSFFYDEESSRLFDLYDDWKREEFLRYAQEVGCVIQVTKESCWPARGFKYKRAQRSGVDSAGEYDGGLYLLHIDFVRREPAERTYGEAEAQQRLERLLGAMRKEERRRRRAYLDYMEAEIDRIFEKLDLPPIIKGSMAGQSAVTIVSKEPEDFEEDVFEPEEFVPEEFEQEVFEPEEFVPEEFVPEDFEQEVFEPEEFVPEEDTSASPEPSAQEDEEPVKKEESPAPPKEKPISEMSAEEFRTGAVRALMEDYGYTREEAEAMVNSPY